MVRHAWIPLIVCLLFLLQAPAGVAGGVDLPVERHVLDNGLTVLLMENHESPTIGFCTAFKVGSSSEWDGVTGITHILEHMLFKGTDKIGTTDYGKEKKLLRRIEDLALGIRRLEQEGEEKNADRIEEMQAEFKELRDEAREYVVANELWETYQNAGGSDLNADTGPDITRYYLALPANRLELWCYLESSRLRNPILREYYTEIENIKEERRLGIENQPDGVLWEELMAAAYKAHSYGTLVIGWMSDIGTIGRTEVEEYFRSHYAPNRMVISIVGDIDADETLKMVETYFGDIPRQPDPASVDTVEPEQRGERRVEREYDAEPQVMIGYHRPAADHPDEPIYQVLTQILNGGRSSRFQRIIVEDEQLAANMDVDSHGAGEAYPTLWVVQAYPRSPHTTAEVEEAIYRELGRLKQEPVGERELQKAKNRLEAGFVRGLNSNFGLARRLASNEAKYGDWEIILRQREAVRDVTPDDIIRVARETFSRKNRTVATLVPITPDEGAPVSAEAQAEAVAVLTRAMDAMGGEAKLDAVSDITTDTELTITTPGGPMPATTHSETLLPDMSLTEVGIMGMVQKQGSDGTNWWAEAMGSVQDFPPEKVRDAEASLLRELFFFRFPDIKDELRLEVVESEEEGEDGLDLVEVTSADGTVFRIGFDPQTGLPQRMAYDTSHPMTGAPARGVDLFSDYREVDGIMLAHEVKSSLDGNDFMTTRVTSVKLNRGLQAAQFARPSS